MSNTNRYKSERRRKNELADTLIQLARGVLEREHASKTGQGRAPTALGISRAAATTIRLEAKRLDVWPEDAP